MALNKPGQQYSFDDIRRELALGAGPVSMADPRIQALLNRRADQTLPIDFNGFQNTASYRPPASLQFTAARSLYLVRNCPAGSNPQRYTINVWVKQLAFVNNNYFMAAYNSAGNYDNIGFLPTGAIQAYCLTVSVFRWRLDTIKTWPLNQWHNVHLTADINNAAIPDRIRLWVNGERQTAFTTNTQPTTDIIGIMNKPGELNYMGIYGSTPYADMRIADHVMLDNVVLDPENFGELIAGVWMPKKFDITKYVRGPASHHLNFAAADDVTSVMINLSTGRAPILSSTTDWRVFGAWNNAVDITRDRPNFGGSA